MKKPFQFSKDPTKDAALKAAISLSLHSFFTVSGKMDAKTIETLSDGQLIDAMLGAFSAGGEDFENLKTENIIRLTQRLAMQNRANQIVREKGNQHPMSYGAMAILNAANRIRGNK